MYLYIVSNPFMQVDVVKVGYMSSAPSQIVKRYKTYYGTETTAMCWVCSDAKAIEKEFKDRFGCSRVELELYSAKHVMCYVNWLTETTGVTPYVCTGAMFPPTTANRNNTHAMLTRLRTKSGQKK